jgi:ElaB/YqjD/DUF883 family membrane-anchored ribosome-binding protein
MLLPDEIAQTTEALEELPRMFNHRNSLDMYHDHMFQETQTDSLPALTPDTFAGATRWQAEIASIHRRHQQELALYQQHLHNIVAEHNRLYDAYEELEERHQDLFHNFQDCVEEEAQKRITQATHIVLQSPEQAPILFPNLVRTIEQYCRQREDKSLAEALYLKREVYRMTQLLEREREQLQAEQQQLLTQQDQLHAQAERHHKALRARWRVISIVTSLGLAAVLVLFQFVFLTLWQVHLTAAISLAITAPMLLCLLLAFVLAGQVGSLRKPF